MVELKGHIYHDKRKFRCPCKWTLVDLELACKLHTFDAPIPFHPALRYSAPELFEGEGKSCSSEVYNLARLLEFVYCNGALATPFYMTSQDVLDRMNCSLNLKNVIRKATALKAHERYQTCAEFAVALETAQDPEKNQAAIVGVYVQEKEKIGRALTNCIVGVASVMLITRALVTLLASLRGSDRGWVELSDRPIVGAFHGIIGSVIWGSLLPLSFLLLWPLQVRRTIMGSTSGSPSGWPCGVRWGCVVFILVCSGYQAGHSEASWMVAAERYRCQQNAPDVIRHKDVPGLSAGRYADRVWCWTQLSLKMRRLSGASLKGLDPLPSKTHRTEPSALGAALEFVARAPWIQTVLLLPVAFSWLAAKMLNPHGVTTQQEWHRTLGEGFVQALGATGLVIGFFYGIVAPKASSTNSRIWRKPLMFAKKVSQLSKRYGGLYLGVTASSLSDRAPVWTPSPETPEHCPRSWQDRALVVTSGLGFLKRLSL